tara:strand:+ start:254 stop:766 length:513 start_codon:yes stop_codon:yes gene_type:complete
MEYILTATEDRAVLGIEKARLMRLGYDETGRQNSMTLYVYPKPGKYPEAYNTPVLEVFKELGVTKSTQLAYFTLEPKSWGSKTNSNLNKNAIKYATIGMLLDRKKENYRFSVIRNYGKKTMQKFEEIIDEFQKLHGPYTKTADIPGRIEIFHTDLCEHILGAYDVEEIED